MSMNEDAKRRTEMVNMSKQPWFNAAYKAALTFYEKDSQLDSKDRLELSKTYKSIATAQLYGGWLGFSASFLTPFFWQFYKTNSIKGVKVPRNFILSILVMMGSSHFSSNYAYKKKLNELNPTGTFQNSNLYGDDLGSETDQPAKSNAQRQWEMMQVLRNGGSTKWAAYFYLTFQNPERRLPDPKVKFNEMIQGQGQMRPGGLLQNRDILGLYTGPEAERRRREGITEGKQQEQPSKSSWDSIREENGVPGGASSSNGLGSSWNKLREGNLSQEKPRDEQEFSNDESDPFAVVDHPSQSEFDTMLERERRGGED
ncbi:hypothetical protein ZYGR_0I03790 [Zygosaccharomyces rouxii]|uniref:Uncharacterized protein n=1 Tax=Zygosaccharomyces rouxii TaxID=4956 RepID=A0A1Q2ZX37_ZYGRO|nr:hypothetical protein ZYGR_0I03790 [Zygosaccharomyces rouxii]